MSKLKKNYAPDFKAKVALAALCPVPDSMSIPSR
jgi:hypothetical protein